MRFSELIFTPVITGLALLSSILPAGATQAGTVPVKHATQYCATVVSKELDSDGNSRILGRQCSEVSEADALAKANASAGRQAGGGGVVGAASTKLLEEYQDANYGGDLLYTYYGSQGTCDGMGYHLVNYLGVEYKTSSMIGFGACNRVIVNDEQSNFGYFDLPAPGLGRWNDRVTALRVYSG